MFKLNQNLKFNIYGGVGWNNVVTTGLIGSSLNSILAMINQIVYNNNPNPLYNTSSVYNDTSSRLYIRGSSNWNYSTIAVGKPVF